MSFSGYRLGMSSEDSQKPFYVAEWIRIDSGETTQEYILSGASLIRANSGTFKF